MDSDRLKKALQGVIRNAIAGGRDVDYRAFYPAKVVAQAADFSLDLVPDDSRLPTLQRVPLRLGLPGVSAKVAPGSYVLLFFEGGAPGGYAAALWQSSSLLELVITASTKVTVNAPDVRLGDGLSAVVRVGDVLTGLTSPSGPVTGAITTAAPAFPAPPTKVKA